MKKIIITSFFFFILCISALAQNVGVGTTTPTQKLDVAGNINTTGNLMVNGVAGTNGQVLTMNGGSMQWMDKSRFKNWSMYNTPGAATFTVPSGVTEVMIEMWGAGGGGHNPGGGGGSGAYFCGLIPVSAISSISIVVGDGGSGGNDNTAPVAGGFSKFSLPGFNVFANGGNVGDSTHNSTNTVITFIGGQGGIVSVNTFPANFRNFIQIPGNHGTPTLQSVLAVTSTIYNTIFTGGIGGVAPFSGLSADTPLYQYNNGTATIRSGISSVGSAIKFACGGSVIFNALFGNSGADGMVIIYY